MLVEWCICFFFGLKVIFIFCDEDTFGEVNAAYLHKMQQSIQFLSESASISQKKRRQGEILSIDFCCSWNQVWIPLKVDQHFQGLMITLGDNLSILTSINSPPPAPPSSKCLCVSSKRTMLIKMKFKGLPFKSEKSQKNMM